jgi:hypothetical protein
VSRPDWDESKPGSHPALTLELTDAEKAAVKAKEQEAVGLADSRASGMMTDEQKLIAGWMQSENVARSSLDTFSNPDVNVDERETRIAEQKQALAQALYKLGRLDEALVYADQTLSDRIIAVAEAIQVDDQLDPHECPRPTSMVDHFGQQVEIELDRRWAEEQILSPRHGQVVWVWHCQVCGQLNATPETPERQQQAASSRVLVAASIAEGKQIPRALHAGVLLKKA